MGERVGVVLLAALFLQGCQSTDTPAAPATAPPGTMLTPAASLPNAAPSHTTGSNATDAPLPAPVDPNAAQLSPPGPYLVHQSVATTAPPPAAARVDLPSGISAGTDLIVRHPDGRPAAQWRLPGGGTVRRVSDAFSPDGRWLAFVSGDLPDWHLTAPITTPLTLHVWDLAAGEEAFAEPILHPGIREDLRRQAAPDAGAAEWEAAARAENGKMAEDPTSLLWGAEDISAAFLDGIGEVKWSPDGRHLAFVGALDGPSGDIYVLDVDGWRVTRASDEPTHVIRLAWSPDSRWILHEGASIMSRAGGYTPFAETTDVAAVDGSSQRHVWSGSGTGPPRDAPWPDAWLGDHDAVVHHQDNGCGVCDIVRIDASTGISKTVVAQMEAENFVVDRTSKLAAIADHTNDPARDEIDGSVYIVDLDRAGVPQKPRPASDQGCRVARWGTDELPFVWLSDYGTSGCSPTAFGPGGHTLPIEPDLGESRSSVSPTGQWRVLLGEGGWRLFDRTGQQRNGYSANGIALNGSPFATVVSWRPDETGLFWLANHALWVVELPDGAPREVGAWTGPDDNGFDVAWLNP